MIRMLERFRQLAQVRTFAPVVLLVVSVPTHPDPVGKRATGYAGVIPVPATSISGQTPIAHLDPLLEGHRDTRAERGRVLYAAGHAPRDTSSVARTNRRRPCPEQRVVEAARATAPNS
jgi:hypothetical protein